MWVLKQKDDGTIYLTWDRFRRMNHNLRGLWEPIGPIDNKYTEMAVRVNKRAGHLCCADDQGNMRVLVLED
jgi:hypothetical protein